MSDLAGLAPYLAMFDEYYFEVGEAFRGLADDKVWRRPDPSILSVGELAGHIAYWEAVRYAGGSEGQTWESQAATSRIESPLVRPHFRYYTTTVAGPLPAGLETMTAAQVHAELVRVHKESMESLAASGVGLDDPVPGWPADTTVRGFLSYSLFHISYHTGQMYTVRHLLGDETPDN
ncbi:MAG: DinB family protein [Fimbriimonadaceae bacterium]|nr:DinB family protein [Fimbriimonadaceae bacterium]